MQLLQPNLFLNNSGDLFVSFSTFTEASNPGNPNSPPENPSVPEPTTWMMMLQGLGLLGFVMFRHHSHVRSNAMMA
ncbi:PEPxxWA-CTERM sorting domain-containing protein [Candidatus Nitrosacidococcus sp. I8]|uniref:PEPxxWA-CTERM sorting domain-containing protein n=1 Tax=Candidatus Nitrosacidococcus sp. I8 TaxID=2942908 RepID=UPI002227AFD8|nr:PEPxxWA-CTERM sorting domain-containing protein [Candidatus Nitrosacidococcus sp. I8]CAH9019026.1 hypothetical protein NURINAE_01285 [Candidatus Nitrosacidococcus sp. I8]